MLHGIYDVLHFLRAIEVLGIMRFTLPGIYLTITVVVLGTLAL